MMSTREHPISEMGHMVISSVSAISSTAPGDATPETKSDVELEKDEISIPFSAVLRALNGVAIATKTADDEIELIKRVFTTGLSLQTTLGGATAFSFRDWQAHSAPLALEESQRRRANLAIAIAFLCQSGRKNVRVSAADLDLVWFTVHEALTTPSILFSVSRSSQGFLSVPLLSLMKDGDIDELFRLHVWEANDLRGTPDLAIHAHQPFIQSWILAGEGRNHTYKVYPAEPGIATHAEYDVFWSSGDAKETSKTYHIKPNTSTLVNKGKLVRVVKEASESHTTAMSYCVPSNVFHSSEVASGTFHATLAFFDSHRGFHRNAPVLGPWDGTSYTTKRDPAGVMAVSLAKMVDSFRRWAELYELGMQHTNKAEWEEALQAFQKALHNCESDPHFPAARQYKYTTMAELGYMYRMLGRNELASGILEEALREMSQNQLRVQILGKLAVVYRHMDRLDDSKKACEDEYNTASLLGLDRDVCRAVGTLGMINYQLSLTRDPSLITTAMEQLAERVDRARKLKTFAMEQLSDIDARAELIEWASRSEAIGLGRLSLCYQRQGDAEQAISSALEAFQIQSTTRDPTKIGFARGFYGLALLNAGRREEALAQFNLPSACSPIVAMAKESSDEHREYIRRMIDAGADPELRDEQGYSALECAVYNGDTKTQRVIEDGLRSRYIREAEEKLERQIYEAVLRKGYRDLFQDRLRPVLLRSGGADMIQKLRTVYAQALDQDEEKSRMFDHLKYVRYTDFLRSGKLPRSSDGVTRRVTLREASYDKPPFIVFISYKWLPKTLGSVAVTDSPDDACGTQYQRIVRALDQFLKIHPDINPENLGIWLDFACVEQGNHDYMQRGVAALLMNLSQCNAMISLTDDGYYERAWCCVEALMIQTLREAYGRHIWYQYSIDAAGKTWSLLSGPTPSEMTISLGQKEVTYEADRPKLLFLERQTRVMS